MLYECEAEKTSAVMVFWGKGLGGDDELELLSEPCKKGLLDRFEGLVLLGLGPPAISSLVGVISWRSRYRQRKRVDQGESPRRRRPDQCSESRAAIQKGRVSEREAAGQVQTRAVPGGKTASKRGYARVESRWARTGAEAAAAAQVGRSAIGAEQRSRDDGRRRREGVAVFMRAAGAVGGRSAAGGGDWVGLGERGDATAGEHWGVRPDMRPGSVVENESRSGCASLRAGGRGMRRHSGESCNDERVRWAEAERQAAWQQWQRAGGEASACKRGSRGELGGCGLESWWLRLRARIAGLVEGKVRRKPIGAAARVRAATLSTTGPCGNVYVCLRLRAQ